MRDAGVYTQLWKKYLPVIRLLLKKTADTDQKLQIYKHEFASTGAKNKLGYIFNLEIVNGKAVNKSAAIAVSFDLLNANDVQIDLIDITGKTIRATNSMRFAAGMNEISLNTADITQGIYFVKVSTTELSKTTRLVIIK